MQKREPKTINGKPCYQCPGCKLYLQKSKYHVDESRWNKITPRCRECRK